MMTIVFAFGNVYPVPLIILELFYGLQNWEWQGQFIEFSESVISWFIFALLWSIGNGTTPIDVFDFDLIMRKSMILWIFCPERHLWRAIFQWGIYRVYTLCMIQFSTERIWVDTTSAVIYGHQKYKTLLFRTSSLTCLLTMWMILHAFHNNCIFVQVDGGGKAKDAPWVAEQPVLQEK